jgi:hypothetical protein
MTMEQVIERWQVEEAAVRARLGRWGQRPPAMWPSAQVWKYLTPSLPGTASAAHWIDAGFCAHPCGAREAVFQG